MSWGDEPSFEISLEKTGINTHILTDTDIDQIHIDIGMGISLKAYNHIGISICKNLNVSLSVV